MHQIRASSSRLKIFRRVLFFAFLIFAAAMLAAAVLAVARDHAEQQLRRMEKLFEQKMGSAIDVEEAKAALAKAKQDEATAAQMLVQVQIDLENSVVRAPVNCSVLDRSVNPGESAQVGQPIFRLGTLDSVLMVAEVAVEKVGSVAPGLEGETGL